ncbi:right-handed parallel beta-helix repeat-containing protein [Sphingomonas canadensis]|uniref:Right-handed parallel beta-helix repeat-containing protein n=1 Tax=Sphingomonas canadensis TaxID=1219257 RepID=A0ABW3HC15_9SPHN|nr:right-handed parallel beta-helix repeat-containing protein [Sphingomonas canadensis]MCW3836365.1 right-handed parallel beta-helix repeat-containing protein [Sphingomonas canadensis]
MPRAVILLAAAAALAAPAMAQRQGAPFTIAETGEGFATLADALRQAGDRRATILIAPGTYRQCAVQEAGEITFKAVQPGTAIFEKETCEDKAALVLRGRGSVVDGLVFRHYEVSDGNGAGIRIEQGDLIVRNSMFLDSQEGILGGNPSGQRITIDHSTFAGLGQCETWDCSHSIYLANKGQVIITSSRFERGTGGHYVKLRVPNVQILDSSFDDTAGSKTNYMIDLPEGGTGLIARNTFVQGVDKENWSGFIVVAAENKNYSAAGLTVTDNDASLAPGVKVSPAFVADLSGEPLRISGNRLGPGLREFERRK